MPKFPLAAASCVLAAALGLTACSSAPTADTQAGPSPAESSSEEGSFHVVDVAGRDVSFDKRPEKIVLAEGRGVFATSILNREDPLANVVALGEDLHTAAPSFESKFAEVNAHYRDLPRIGNIAKGDVSVENLVSFTPDVVVMTLDHKKAAETTGFLDSMDKAGLKYVFTDFRQKPLENTPRSMELLGKLFDREDKAQEFNEFYTDRVTEITERAQKQPQKPRTLLWRAAGLKDCCATVKNSNLGDLVNAAGGHNIGDDLLDTESGDLTAEKVVAEQPELIIATGGSWAKDPEKPEVLPHVELGYAATKEQAETTLAGLLRTPGFGTLNAPKEGELHAVYHQFYDSPFNVFALEQFAVWLHPEEFKDLDPAADFADFHSEHLPFELSGTFFATAS
ncbi:ABC transporter substrate-binding protein [Corynebacterium sp.]|uniref:ABC transporter substrate-binding protein n=1 Tax=Corynebacterium sp. TaxID=1720 RepID=UPI0026DA815F|nr:ABC transporter substrate-binding protein [Corynebacterium sp.]MDO5032769.1 ABC transporter substrate-binding protein [Corynebacterium sp.]